MKKSQERTAPLSDAVVSLLDGMLAIKPRERLSVYDGVAHPWFTTPLAPEEVAVEESGEGHRACGLPPVGVEEARCGEEGDCRSHARNSRRSEGRWRLGAVAGDEERFLCNGLSLVCSPQGGRDCGYGGVLPQGRPLSSEGAEG